MIARESYFPQRREQLVQLLRNFEAQNGRGPTPLEIRHETGWDLVSIRRYLHRLVLEGERVPVPARPRNNDRFAQRREQLLAYLRQYQSENGYPPTMREISMGTGWCFNAVEGYIQRLAREGAVYYRPFTQRTVAIRER